MTRSISATRRLVIGALSLVAGAALAATPAPTPAPSLLSPVLADALGAPSAAVAASQEWMVIQAARIIDDWTTMREQSEALVKRMPGEGDGYAALGAALEGLGRRAAAIAALERAVELRPGMRGAWLMLGMLRSASGDHEQAGDAFDHGVAAAPTDRTLLWSSARAWAAAANHAKAAPAYARLVAANPADVAAWAEYAPEALAAGQTDAMWTAFRALRDAHPDIAARVAAAVPAEVKAALPTPVPPTPRPTSRPDAPRLVMGGAPAGGGAATVWSAAALGFEGKVTQIAQKARPLPEMMERYEVVCHGGNPSRSADAGEAAARPGKPGASVAAVAVDWPSVWARTSAWAQAASTDSTAECRTLASDMLAIASSTRAAVDAAVRETTASGMSDAERNAVLEKYGLRW